MKRELQGSYLTLSPLIFKTFTYVKNITGDSSFNQSTYLTSFHLLNIGRSVQKR